MSYFNQGGSWRPMSDINVVPFIDVMLVLLVIFMITAPLLTQGVKVELPKTDAKAMAEKDKEALIVEVDKAGNFYFNLAEKPNQAISAQTLDYLVKMHLSNGAKDLRQVLVRADKNVNYGKVVEAMVLLQKAGAKSVGLITQPGDKEKEKS